MTLERYRIVESSGNYLRVSIEGNDFRTLNALRKTILDNIPSMSITSVVITENTSSLMDEVLGNRLGLLYLFSCDTDFVQYVEEDVYDGENSIKFIMDVTYSPKKNYVMSSDLIWSPQRKQQENVTIKPRVVNKDILLCRLAPGQQIKLEAYATKGCGKINAKFNVVSNCYYRKNEDDKSYSFILEAENGMDPESVLIRGLNML